MIPRVLEAEVMDTLEEARDYDAMDHSEANRAFVDDFLAGFEQIGRQSENPAGNKGPLEILDVGTGTARIPIELLGRKLDCRIIAVDLARHMLDLARQNVEAAGLQSSIVLEYLDAKQLPYQSDRFPAVISNSIVHHIPEPKAVFAEMVRVTRPGGFLFLRDLLRPENSRTLDHLVATYAAEANEHGRQMLRDSLWAALRLEDVRRILADLGLPPSWARQTSDRHWTVAGQL